MVFGSLAGAAHSAPDGALDRDAKLRARYLQEFKRDVTARFDASLHHLRFLDLKIAHDPAAVRPPWRYYNPELKQNYASVWEALQRCDRRLLLLGHPGAGKTTALLHIAAELLGIAEDSPDAPVPMIVNLSTFRLPRRSDGGGVRLSHAGSAAEEGIGETRVFEDWLVAEMSRFPGLDRKTARRWLRDGRVAVLLDGLDEFNDERRGELTRTLNATFLHDHPALTVVICSRTNEYEILKSSDDTRLQLQGCVQLQPLGDEQVADYLRAAKADALLEALPGDPALQELSRTPLTLAMLVQAYGGQAPALRDKASSLSESRFRLFESYVSRMLQRQARRDRGVPFDDVAANDVDVSRYRLPPDLINRWLGWLAIVMSVRMRTTFSPRSLVGMLILLSQPQRQLINYWVAHTSIGPVLLASLAAIAVSIVPPGAAGWETAALIIVATWLAVPAVVAGGKDWVPGIPLVVVAFVVGIAGGGALLAHALATTLPPAFTAISLYPIVFGVMMGVMTFPDRGLETGYSLMIGSAVVSVVALSLIPFTVQAEFLHIQADIDNHAVATACGWLFVLGGLLSVADKDAVAVVLMVAGIAALAAASILGMPYIEGADGLVVVAVMAAVIGIIHVLMDDVRYAVAIVAVCGPVVAAGGILAGATGATVAGAAFLTVLTFGERIPRPTLDGLKILATRGFEAGDSVVFSRVAWVFLASLRRLPYGGTRFLKAAVDAFILKRSMRDFEFTHRLLRDYFALRELMPRLRRDEASRVAAIRTLGYQGEAAIDILVEFVGQGSAPIRAAAVSGLGHIPSPVSTQCLERVVVDRDPGVRGALIASLAKLPFSDQPRIFREMEPIGDGSEIPVILDAFPYANGSAALFIARMQDSAVQPLLAAMKQGNATRKVAACRYVANVHDTRLSAALVDLLANRNASVRAAAAGALANKAYAVAVGPLEKLLRDRDNDVRYAARAALRQYYDKVVIGP